MKNRQYNKTMRFPSIILFAIAALSLFIAGCGEDPEYHSEKSKNQVITDYITTNSDKYSEFGKMLNNTELNRILSIRGPFTLLLPTNDAVKAYCAEKNVASVDELDIELQKNLVLNHLISAEIKSSEIGLGALLEKNALGDKVASEFRGIDTYFNKQSKLIKRDIKAANGYIHIIDKVIDIVTEDAYQKLVSLGKFTLFTKGLEITGLKDTLQLIEFPFGNKQARTRYTIFAVPDSVFNANGIYSIDDLVNRYTNAPDRITEIENGFYRYMEYHCLAETYYLSDFPVNDGFSKLYPILSFDNNISMIIKDDYYLNMTTNFNIPESNYPSKNAAIHTINGLLEVVQPAPTKFTFEVTDHFDLKQGDYFGKYYMKWSDGQNTFKNIKWEGDYLEYYYKEVNGVYGISNKDCLSMNGFWWIEVTTPKIMKGRYTMNTKITSGYIDYDVYVDGVYMSTVKKADNGNNITVATVNWDKTETHKVKIVAVSSGMLFWDEVSFTPY